jgi:hypothetical protein
MKSFQRTQQYDPQNDNSFEELSYEPQASNSKTNPKLTAIEKIFGKVNDSTKEISITNGFKSYINVSYSHNCDLLYWWQNNEKEFPILSKLAKKYLSIPSTSVSSERIFSSAGNLISKKRSALKPKLVNQLVFLNKNYKHFNN